MRKITLVLSFLICFSASAQHTISGTFSPAKDYSWLIAYRLKPGTQVYAADTAIKNGAFKLQLPEEATQGTYRLVYAVPQEEFYFDVIYNGTEDINLRFNRQQGVTFTGSKENILFSTYFKETERFERSLIDFYAQGSLDRKEFAKITQNWKALQHSYDERSVNLIAQAFIQANRPYIPDRFETLQEYVKNRKRFYFDHLDLSNSVLQASGFLTDKLANYVFTALPLEQLEQAETEKEMQANISRVVENLEGISDAYTFHILYTLWTQSAASNFNNTADFIYSEYLKPAKAATLNQELLHKIEIYNRLRIGAVAPEIVWMDGDKEAKLSALQGAKNYMLVFWSSTCSHCLNELPALHKELKAYQDIKVIAVGLEDDDQSWNIESRKLENFEHAIALGKWDSEYAEVYDIQATPTYFILDENKRIMAKPESDKEVIEFLRER